MNDLSDRELSDKLREYGVNVGPIVATTRRFYEKKLQKIIDSGGVIEVEPEEEYSQSEEEMEEDEPVQRYDPPPPAPKINKYEPPPPAPKINKPSPIQTTTYTTTTVTRRTVQEPVDDIKPHSKAAKPKPQPPSPQTEKKGGIPMWIKMLILLVVVFFVFLVFHNMEPSSENVIPKLPDDSNV